jgi:hypothetical protein
MQKAQPARKVCSQHEGYTESLKRGDERMERIEKSLDKISDRQIDYITKQEDLAKSVNAIKVIVENGLQKNVKQLEAAAIQVDAKIKTLSEGQWFIDIVNEFRTGLVKRCLKFAFFGGVVALSYTAIIAFGNDVFPKIIAKLF